MNRVEVRMRCVEALSNMGVREPGRLIRDAEALEEWVIAGDDSPFEEEKPTALPKKRGRPPKSDNQQTLAQ